MENRSPLSTGREGLSRALSFLVNTICLGSPGQTRVSLMKTPTTEKTRYKISEFYRKQPYGAVINQDRATRWWSWKGYIDLQDGPYSEFSSRRSFTTGSEAEEHMRRFAHGRIDDWLRVIEPGSM
jgi:hypothetical protein